MNRPLRILHLVHDSRRSGVPAVAAGLMRAMGKDVSSDAFFAYEGIYASELRAEGFRVFSMGRRFPFFWRFFRFLMAFPLLGLVRRYDVIHVHSIKLAHLVLIARAAGGRVVYHLHELPGRIGPLLRAAIGAADATVFCSRACASHYEAIPARCKRTIVNAMELSDRPPVIPRRRTGKVVMAASLNRGKGQHYLLEAFSRLRDTRTQLWLYGTVGLSARGYVRHLKEFVRAKGLQKRVFFPGPTTDIASVLRDAEVVAHTSANESFGMVILEAMAEGVPVVAHEVGGTGEIIDDGVTGFLVKPGDISALAASLEILLSDDGVWSKMGAAAWSAVRSRFSMADRAAEYHRLYGEVAGE